MPDKTHAPINQLILGDNLEILKNMESESIDLIYLDPPFFSNRQYEIIWKRQTAKKGSQFKRRSFGQYADKVFVAKDSQAVKIKEDRL